MLACSLGTYFNEQVLQRTLYSVSLDFVLQSIFKVIVLYLDMCNMYQYIMIIKYSGNSTVKSHYLETQLLTQNIVQATCVLFLK